MDSKAYKLQYELEKFHWWFQARAYLVLNFINNPPSILDFGCGTGLMLEILQKKLDKKILIFGADNSEHSLKICKQIPNISIIDLNSIKIQEIPEKFDIILCMDVLEHIKNEHAFLQELNFLLQPNGKIIFTVPAFNFLWSGEDFISHHYRNRYF